MSGMTDMRGGTWVRSFHRWVSIVFTLAVVANFAAMAIGTGAPPQWVTYAPLLPLALLLFTGLCLFVQPYVRRRRGDRGIARVRKG
jgi:membrane protein YdbS with pleckstrin-like domain